MVTGGQITEPLTGGPQTGHGGIITEPPAQSHPVHLNVHGLRIVEGIEDRLISMVTMVPSWEWEDLSILSLGQDLSFLSMGQDLSLRQGQFLSYLSMVLSYLSMVTMVLSFLSMVTMVACGEVTRQQDHQDGGAKV